MLRWQRVARAEVGAIEAVAIPGLAPCPASWHEAAKRLLDVGLSMVLLLVLSPLLVLIALCIKIDSRGPVLYQQLRHGRGNSVIRIFKFRTMYWHLCDPPGLPIVQARRLDPRVTRVGRFLRRSSLDELPQLLQVLAGTMSLVGPRPHPVAFLEVYEKFIEGYARRHAVKPGITGWAQVHGLRGETPTVEHMRQRFLCDDYYVTHRSTWLDLRILCLTARYVLTGTNAH